MEGIVGKAVPLRVNAGRGAATPIGAETCRDCGVQAYCFLARQSDDAAEAPQPRIHAFAAGDALARAGEVEREMKVIRTGLVYGFLEAVDGPRPTGFLSRGTVIGKSSYHDEPNPASVTAASDGAYCAAPTAAVVQWTERNRAFRRAFERVIARDMVALMHWVAALGRPGVAAQLAGTLLLLAEAQRSDEVMLPSHTLLSRLLGTTRETVARMLGQLESDGCLERDRPRQARLSLERLQTWLVQDTPSTGRRDAAQASLSGQFEG